MIISISGYAGSGKDTAGQLIQYMASGQSDKMSFKQWQNSTYIIEQQPWEIKKWAGKLKTIASLLTGIDPVNFEDQEFKKTTLGPEWSKVDVAMDPMTEQEYVYESHMTVRDFLQRLGTDGLRNGLHTNVWVNALIADYSITEKTINYGQGISRYVPASKWVITDTRFPNELDAVKQAGGITIRIDRDGIKPVNAHPSETALDNAEFDYVIPNNGDVEDLLFKLRLILHKHNLI